jgi:HEAT repeat protein
MIGRRKTPDPSARLHAVRQLPDEAASCAALLKAARDPSLDVARAALRRLAKLGGANEATELRKRLLSVDLGLVAVQAATLRALGDARATYVARAGLTDDSSTTRIAAALALAELGDPTSAPALTLATRDPIAGVRRFAIEALGNFGRSAESEAACRAALADSDVQVRAAAVRTLARIAPEFEPVLRPIATDDASEVRRELASLSGQLSTDLVRRLVVEDHDADVRAHALWGLVRQPQPGLLGVLLAATDDPAWRVRRAACRALGASGDKRARKRLTRMLLDPHEAVRAAATRALSELFGQRLVEELSTELDDRDPRLRRAIVYALGSVGSEDAATRIAGLATDDSSEVRVAVANMLAEFGDTGSASVMRYLAGDEDPHVRAAAATALHRLHTTHAR